MHALVAPRQLLVEVSRPELDAVAAAGPTAVHQHAQRAHTGVPADDDPEAPDLLGLVPALPDPRQPRRLGARLARLVARLVLGLQCIVSAGTSPTIMGVLIGSRMPQRVRSWLIASASRLMKQPRN